MRAEGRNVSVRILGRELALTNMNRRTILKRTTCLTLPA
jgi:hypothetical protein